LRSRERAAREGGGTVFERERMALAGVRAGTGLGFLPGLSIRVVLVFVVMVLVLVLVEEEIGAGSARREVRVVPNVEAEVGGFFSTPYVISFGPGQRQQAAESRRRDESEGQHNLGDPLVDNFLRFSPTFDRLISSSVDSPSSSSP